MAQLHLDYIVTVATLVQDSAGAGAEPVCRLFCCSLIRQRGIAKRNSMALDQIAVVALRTLELVTEIGPILHECHALIPILRPVIGCAALVLLCMRAN